MPVTVVCGTQRVSVYEPHPGTAEDEWETCYLGRGGSDRPVQVVLGQDPMLSRRAVAVRCADDWWWQVRRVGDNGVVVQCENGATIPVETAWVDVPQRYGRSYVRVTSPQAEHDFKVEYGATGAAVSPSAPASNDETRHLGRHGYWRVAVALCEPSLRDGSDRVPTHTQIAGRLDSLGLEPEGFGQKTVEKRVAYLYRITGIVGPNGTALVRRLIESGVVVRDDVRTLLDEP